MECVPIASGFVCFAKTDFKCPHCKKQYDDIDDKYVNRCNKNKNGMTKIKCGCGDSFWMTYNFTGEAMSFI